MEAAIIAGIAVLVNTSLSGGLIWWAQERYKEKTSARLRLVEAENEKALEFYRSNLKMREQELQQAAGDAHAQRAKANAKLEVLVSALAIAEGGVDKLANCIGSGHQQIIDALISSIPKIATFLEQSQSARHDIFLTSGDVEGLTNVRDDLAKLILALDLGAAKEDPDLDTAKVAFAASAEKFRQHVTTVIHNS
jgi:hypothetical protein